MRLIYDFLFKKGSGCAHHLSPRAITRLRDRMLCAITTLWWKTDGTSLSTDNGEHALQNCNREPTKHFEVIPKPAAAGGPRFRCAYVPRDPQWFRSANIEKGALYTKVELMYYFFVKNDRFQDIFQSRKYGNCEFLPTSLRQGSTAYDKVPAY